MSVIPVAMSVRQLMPAMVMPMCWAAMASMAVLMPTASAPMILNMLVSATLSYWGPEYCMYTPSAISMSWSSAASLMAWVSSLL